MSFITDTMTITELSRITGKSRPTVYKWIMLYECGRPSELPSAVTQLFDILARRGTKSEVYEFCERAFSPDGIDELRDIIELLRNNKDKLDLDNIKKFILEELYK